MEHELACRNAVLLFNMYTHSFNSGVRAPFSTPYPPNSMHTNCGSVSIRKQDHRVYIASEGECSLATREGEDLLV